MLETVVDELNHPTGCRGVRNFGGWLTARWRARCVPPPVDSGWNFHGQLIERGGRKQRAVAPYRPPERLYAASATAGRAARTARAISSLYAISAPGTTTTHARRPVHAINPYSAGISEVTVRRAVLRATCEINLLWRRRSAACGAAHIHAKWNNKVSRWHSATCPWLALRREHVAYLHYFQNDSIWSLSFIKTYYFSVLSHPRFN